MGEDRVRNRVLKSVLETGEGGREAGRVAGAGKREDGTHRGGEFC